MAKVSTEKFLELLGRSGLVEEKCLTKFLADFQSRAEEKLPDNPKTLANALVERNILTRWQANNLLEGKHKGFVLGKYKLLGHLGTGGMSSVYLAEHQAMRHRVAIKVLPRSRVEDSSYLARFQLEARAAASLNHINIVRAFDIDNKDSMHYLVMEYVEGCDLQAKVKLEGPLDYEHAADFIAQAADGLQHAHDLGLVHRDIKPANLLVDMNNTIKILDMGLAKFSADDQPSLTIAHDENVLGTADYLAPEQAINSHGVDHRADIYSLGCTLYYCLTGHPPFPEGTLPQRLLKHQNQAPSSIYEDRSDAPQALVNVCLRMMVKNPEGRYQSAREAMHDLRAYLQSAAGASSASGVRAGPQVRSDGKPGEPGVRKHLKTRKSDWRPLPRPRPSSSSSIIHSKSPGSSDTIKTLSSRSTLTRMPIVTATPPMPSSTNLGSQVLPAQPPSGARASDSGKSVLDSGAVRSKGGKPAHSSTVARRTSQQPSSRTPSWVWFVMGGGAILILTLITILLNH